MKARADLLAPDVAGVLISRAAFFRRGGVGHGANLLTSKEHAAYLHRVRSQVPADLADWLLRP